MVLNPGSSSRRRSSHPAVTAFPDNVVGSACTSSFSRPAQRSLALRPAHSRRHLYVTCYTEGFSHFVTSMTAPIASGWSACRVGLAPTGKRRLSTAHARSTHCLKGEPVSDSNPKRTTTIPEPAAFKGSRSVAERGAGPVYTSVTRPLW